MRTLHFGSVVTFFLLFFLAYSQRLEIGCLPYFHTRCGNTGCKNDVKNRHLRTISDCTTLSSYIFSTKACIDNRKKVSNSNISSTCPYNMANYGPLTAEIDWRVWSTPENFNGFRVLASLLQRCHSLEANQTLHDVWPSHGLVHYVYIFEGSCP